MLLSVYRRQTVSRLNQTSASVPSSEQDWLHDGWKSRDHKQLKPKPAVYQLAKKYGMEVSLFERMLKNGLGCSVLGVQHRMRPEIASLIVPTIYPSLANHPSTFDRPRVSGIDKFVFFLTHNKPEDQGGHMAGNLLQEPGKYQKQFFCL
ncbi:NFX1-type zinc finger-containing protein 1 [Homalodisca vitripennis]|nr:NFX1-type zinc finger-containing protein 1 [Homalodisca vitripennis]